LPLCPVPLSPFAPFTVLFHSVCRPSSLLFGFFGNDKTQALMNMDVISRVAFASKVVGVDFGLIGFW